MFVNGDEKTGSKLLNRKAREEMKARLLQDILFDMQVCKIERLGLYTIYYGIKK